MAGEEEINIFRAESDGIEEHCEPCSAMDKSVTALMFCPDCKETLCNNCADVHKSQKMTKSHLLVSISDIQKPATKYVCEPCSERGLQENATAYCNACDEDLCSDCGKRHTLQKATRDHELVDIKIKQVTAKGDSSLETSSNLRSTRKCEPCHVNGKNIIATIFCKECNEYLCQNCSAYHRKQKFARNHALFDVDIIPVKFCEPCTEGGAQIEATKECETCVECLCDSCSKAHQSQKATKHHQLKAVSLPEFQDCCPCSEGGKVVFAVRFCEECKEYMCGDCSKLHARQKTTNNHVLFSAIAASVRDSATEDDSKPHNKELQKTEEEKTKLDEKQKQDELRPGKPFADKVLSDSLVLQWEVLTKFESDTPTYQLRYKEKVTKRWTFHTEQPHRAYVEIMGLKSQCTYIFQVRAIDDDIEGPYSPESEEITTRSSLASTLLPFTTKTEKVNPSIHKLNITENMWARDDQAKTRKFDLGKPPVLNDMEKTILLVGATGSGKSTLVDGIINYITGVNWKDPFRFTLIDLESDEKNKNQAVSQTEWITSYSVNPAEGSRLNYRLNIIDTPGFGDTRGLERDNEIVNQLRKLFSSKGAKGVRDIDAVCFLMKAPDARLTAVQKYIFMAILSLFGQDIEDNICTLITFADGDTPPVLAAMQEAKLPIKSWYPFNNSGLFANNGDKMSSLAPMFWEMGSESFKSFFDKLWKLPKKSLQQTKQVLIERERLETTICQLQPQIDAGLSKIHELKQEIQILTQNEKKILDNKDFEYEVEETEIVMTELPVGEHVTNCMTCNRTCHPSCAYANDDDKRSCSAMGGDGNCTVCPGHCYWNKHCNNPYRFTFVSRKVRKTYTEKLKMYQEAGKQKLSHEQVIEKMKDDLDYLGQTINNMMLTINDCNNTLKDIALHPHPLSMVEHIDLMIESEKMEKKNGFKDRIKVLNAYRKRAEIHKDVDKLNEEFASMKMKNSPSEKGPRGFFSKLFNW